MADRTFYLNINDGFLSTSNSLINQDIWKKTSNGLNIYYNKTNKNVNVGINNNNPTKTLDVTGDIQFSGDLYKNNELVDLTGGGGGGGSTVLGNVSLTMHAEAAGMALRVVNTPGLRLASKSAAPQSTCLSLTCYKSFPADSRRYRGCDYGTCTSGLDSRFEAVMIEDGPHGQLN